MSTRGPDFAGGFLASVSLGCKTGQALKLAAAVAAMHAAGMPIAGMASVEDFVHQAKLVPAANGAQSRPTAQRSQRKPLPGRIPAGVWHACLGATIAAAAITALQTVLGQ